MSQDTEYGDTDNDGLWILLCITPWISTGKQYSNLEPPIMLFPKHTIYTLFHLCIYLFFPYTGIVGTC